MSEQTVQFTKERREFLNGYCGQDITCMDLLGKLYDECVAALDVVGQSPSPENVRQCFGRFTTQPFRFCQLAGSKSTTLPPHQIKLMRNVISRAHATSQPGGKKRVGGNEVTQRADTFADKFAADRCGSAPQRRCLSLLKKVYGTCKAFVSGNGNRPSHPISRPADDPDDLAGIEVMKESAIAEKTRKCVEDYAGKKYSRLDPVSRYGNLTREDHQKTRAILRIKPQTSR